MANLFSLGIYAIIFLVLMGLVSNTSTMPATSSSSCVYRQITTDTYCRNIAAMWTLQCPLPIYAGVVTNATIVNNAPFYVVNYSNNTGGGGSYGSRFICDWDSSVPDGVQRLNVQSWNYGETLFSAFPSGWFVYASHTMTGYATKVGALATLIMDFFTPIGFSILGYSVFNITPFVLLIVIFMYAIAYLLIGVMLYKTLSPYAS